MPEIKLRYFNARGRAECIRWIMEFAGAKYQDIRFERESWPQLKEEMLTGMVPQLEYDGFVLGESNAIASFLGKKLNLAGKDEQEASRCEMFICLCTDFANKGVKARYEQDEEKKKVYKADFEEKTVPQFVSLMVKLLNDNGGKYLVGNGITYADIVFVCLFDNMAMDPMWTLDPATVTPPPLDGLIKMVKESPNIKAWIEKRPKTLF